MNFVLGDCLGRGAYGSVYKAMNAKTGQVVAVKQISLSTVTETQANSTMMEIDLLKELRHQNIVEYLGFQKNSEFLNIYMEYCENGSIQTTYRKFGLFSEQLAKKYIVQVLHGLKYLHEQGVIHRDLKAGNILTTKDGSVKLADFGVAKKLTNDLEADQTVTGSPYWSNFMVIIVAPEVIEMSGVSTTSDIWSLGCTIVELMQGNPPYISLTPMSAMFRIVQDEHPPLPNNLSPNLQDFLLKCFEKDPRKRISAEKLLNHPWIISSDSDDRNAVISIDAFKEYHVGAVNSSCWDNDFDDESIRITGKILLNDEYSLKLDDHITTSTTTTTSSGKSTNSGAIFMSLGKNVYELVRELEKESQLSTILHLKSKIFEMDSTEIIYLLKNFKMFTINNDSANLISSVLKALQNDHQLLESCTEIGLIPQLMDLPIEFSTLSCTNLLILQQKMPNVFYSSQGWSLYIQVLQESLNTSLDLNLINQCFQGLYLLQSDKSNLISLLLNEGLVDLILKVLLIYPIQESILKFTENSEIKSAIQSNKPLIDHLISGINSKDLNSLKIINSLFMDPNFAETSEKSLLVETLFNLLSELSNIDTFSEQSESLFKSELLSNVFQSISSYGRLSLKRKNELVNKGFYQLLTCISKSLIANVNLKSIFNAAISLVCDFCNNKIPACTSLENLDFLLEMIPNSKEPQLQLFESSILLLNSLISSNLQSQVYQILVSASPSIQSCLIEQFKSENIEKFLTAYQEYIEICFSLSQKSASTPSSRLGLFKKLVPFRNLALLIASLEKQKVALVRLKVTKLIWILSKHQNTLLQALLQTSIQNQDQKSKIQNYYEQLHSELIRMRRMIEKDSSILVREMSKKFLRNEPKSVNKNLLDKLRQDLNDYVMNDQV